MRDQHNRAMYERAESVAYAFVPLSIETYGQLGKRFMGLRNTLAYATAGHDSCRMRCREMNVALRKGSAIMMKLA